MPIRDLTSINSVAGGDQLAIGSTTNGDDRRAPISVLKDYMQSALSFSEDLESVTQYSAPSSTGFSVALTDGDKDNKNIWLILTPTGGFASGTLVLPLNTNLRDKQEIQFISTQSVTTLTIDQNGATSLVGAPTTLSANDFFKLKYDLATSTWYRIG